MRRKAIVRGAKPDESVSQTSVRARGLGMAHFFEPC